jgi:hypothetical protein
MRKTVNMLTNFPLTIPHPPCRFPNCSILSINIFFSEPHQKPVPQQGWQICRFQAHVRKPGFVHKRKQ